MDPEISSWTRRERLERIAAAERDRRAGRPALARASLGEAVEWPARLVLALLELPAEEGASARAVLESALDDWAEQSGFADLNPWPGREADSFETPIGSDELDRAFASAQVETDEMMDVNTVAEHVLLSESFDLAETETEDPLSASTSWSGFEGTDPERGRPGLGRDPDRAEQIARLERWLANLDRRGSASRSGPVR